MKTRLSNLREWRRNLVWIFPILLIPLLFLLKDNDFPEEKQISSLNVRTYGAKGNGTNDDTMAIQEALDQVKKSNKIIQVYIPSGNYKLTKTLKIYRNTHLILEENSIFLRSHNNSFMINGDYGDTYDGYNGNGNIVIEGGIWEGNILDYPDSYNAIGIARAKNITIKNVVFRDISSFHAIDLSSSENVLIENCKFLGFKDTTPNKSRFYSEAIQISEHTIFGFNAFGTFNGTPNKNVEIKNCIFGESGTKGTTAWPVGIGNHYTVYDKYNSNIKIHNNSFQGMTFAGIRNFKWYDTIIKNNKFINCSRGIFLSNPDGNGESSKTIDGVQTALPQSSKKTIISGNTFERTQKENIVGFGWEKNGIHAKIQSLKIENNVFNNQLGLNNRPSIFLSGISDLIITKNQFNHFGAGGITILNSNSFNITENILLTQDSKTNMAILIGNNCESGTIKNNIFSLNNEQKNPINVEDTCTDIQTINNMIKID
ncbi:glycosyl hydrolase family 28-related protein [Bacillus marasmi]|uniref:glycosyl hydrolase family 28-related protein n=1 Tax=Bacillus marasmi TaxID=1926279 RepID=UPI0011C884CB|nr:glycosyl hydrolase family 28-related protein [Bacillus marasmi]